MDSLKDKLLEDMKMAMKNQDQKKMSIIRNIRAIIKNKEIKQTRELTDKEVEQILAEKVKNLQQKKAECNQKEKVEKLKKERDILLSYLNGQDIDKEVLLEKLVREEGK